MFESQHHENKRQKNFIKLVNFYLTSQQKQKKFKKL